MTDQEAIIAIEQAALERWGRGDTDGFAELCAEEMTYFDPFIEQRLDGGEAFRAYMAAARGQVYIYRFEMKNPQVQLHGDVGLLTFNLLNFNEDGSAGARWNSTEVYSKLGGDWRLIHSHWSLVRPAQP